MEPLQDPVRLRMIGANPDVLQLEEPYRLLELGCRELAPVIADDLRLRPRPLQRILTHQSHIGRSHGRGQVSMHHVAAVSIQHRHPKVLRVPDPRVHDVRVPPLIRLHGLPQRLCAPRAPLPPKEQIRTLQDPDRTARTHVGYLRINHLPRQTDLDYRGETFIVLQITPDRSDRDGSRADPWVEVGRAHRGYFPRVPLSLPSCSSYTASRLSRTTTWVSARNSPVPGPVLPIRRLKLPVLT